VPRKSGKQDDICGLQILDGLGRVYKTDGGPKLPATGFMVFVKTV
jgi:hypothetical protein